MVADVYIPDDVDTDRIGGFDDAARPDPGKYHCLIYELNPDGGRKGEMLLTLEVLDGTVPDQVGKLHTERLSHDNKPIAIWKKLALAIAARLITKADVDAAKAAKTTLKIDWTQAVGRTVCVNLVRSVDKNDATKSYLNVNYDEFWDPRDKRANAVPLNAKFLQRDGLVLPPDRPIGGVKPRVPSAVAAPPATPAAAAADKAASVEMDDLLG